MEQGACNIYEKRKCYFSQDPRFPLSVGSGDTHWSDAGSTPFSVNPSVLLPKEECGISAEFCGSRVDGEVSVYDKNVEVNILRARFECLGYSSQNQVY